MIGKKSRIASFAAAAAMTGLIGGAAGTMVGCHHDDAGASMNHSNPDHNCKGMNACKGQGNCKTATHDCKGKNDCKGQGGCKAA